MPDRLAAPFATLLVAGTLALQSAAPFASENQDSARAAVHRAIAELGGADAVARGARVSFTQEGRARSVAQAWSPADPDVNTPRRNSYVIDVDSRRLRFETSTDFPGELRVHALLVLDGGAGFTADPLKWRLGTDVVRVPPAAAEANFAAGSRVLPHLLLLQALAYDSVLTDAGVQEVEGERYRTIEYRDVSGAAVSVYLDPDTFLVRGYAVSRGRAVNRVRFEEYRRVDGLMIPFTTRSIANGEPSEWLRIVDITVAAPLNDGLFAVPDGYSDAPPPSAPGVTRLGEGIFLLRGMPNDYRSMFVDMGDHVVVMEAPVSREYGELALRLIGETLPDTPIRHVLVTHHHGDHTAGLAPFIERGATIVAGEGTGVALRRQLGAAADGMRLELVRDSLMIGHGPRRIEAHVLPNAHADGSLVFHLPAAGILFQGDLLYVPERGPVPAGFAAAEPLARFVASRPTAVHRIIGVHGRPATPAELERAVQLRNRQ